MTTSSHTKNEQPKQKAPDVKPAAPVSEGMEQSFSHEDVAASLKNLESARPETILRLQRVAGNRAVTNMLGQNTKPAAPSAFRSKTGMTVQAKSLMVSTPGDAQEVEADQVSEQIMKMPDKVASVPPNEDETKGGGNAILNRYIQRDAIQRSSEDGIGGNAVSEDTQSRIEGMQQGGQPLPASEREFFEPRMGVDLSNVRVHTDSTAAETSKELNARAYTVGPHVAFNSGEYQPGTTEGRKLMGHELTHVVQQGGAAARKVQREVSMEDAVAEAQKEVTEEDVTKEEAQVEAEPVSIPTGNKLEGVAPADVGAAPSGSVAEDVAAPPAAEAVKAGEDAPAAEDAVVGQAPVPVDAAPGGEKVPAAEDATAKPQDAQATAAIPGETKPGEAKPDPTEEKAAETPAKTPVPSTDKAITAPTETKPAEPKSEATLGAGKTTESGAASTPVAGQPSEAKSVEGKADAAPVAGQEPDKTKADPALAVTAVPAGATPEAPVEAADGEAESATASATATDTEKADGATIPEKQPEEQEDKSLHRMPIKGVVQRYQAPKSAAEDPAFQNVVANSKAVAQSEKKHEPAAAEANKAQAAADPKGTDVNMAAQDRQVGEMKNEPTSGFDAGAFKAKLLASIKDAAPKTLKEAEEIKGSNRINQVKESVKGEVKDQKDKADGSLEEKSEEQPDKSGLQGKDVKPLEQSPSNGPVGDIGASQAAPKNKGQEEVEAPIAEESASLDQQMAENKITDEQLQKSNEPAFNQALESKETAQKNAEEAPDQYRKEEQATLTQAQADAKETADAKVEDTRTEREKLLADVFNKQGETKGVDESKRQEVAGDIADIYLKTKDSVEKSLSAMDTEVDKKFEEGAKKAQDEFESKIFWETLEYKAKRYVDNPLLWIKDSVMGLPPEANYIYEEGRKVYLDKMDECLTGIADYVAKQLNDAKTTIANGQKEIQDYVAKLSPDLQKIGAEAADQIQGKFGELESTVDDKQGELVESLTEKYNEKLKEVDARIDEIKQANSGLINIAKQAIGGVIETIKKLADMLMSTLKSAGDAIQKILQDPITFLTNLLNAVKQGFTQFVGNIGKYLQQGLIDWLTGAIGSAGIKLPKALDDIPGIFNMVLDLLGFTYDDIRAQVVKGLGDNGEAIVSGLETAWDVLMIIKEKGLAGIWEMIQGMLGDLKSMVMDQIKDMVIGQVIEAGVKWLVSMLGGPAGAFIKAVEGIINVVTWFINNGQRIMGIVNGIIGSMTAIANGDIGGAANFIEGILAKSVPTMISFLADLLGLGGIAEKVQGIIQKIKAPVNKVIAWVIKKAKALGKSILGKLKGGKKKEGVTTTDDPANEKNAALAMKEAEQLIQNKELSPKEISKRLPAIKAKYKLSKLELIEVPKDKKTETVYIQRQIETVPKETEKVDKPLPPKELEEIKVDPLFKRNPKHDATEFDNQISMQEDAINKMYVNTWLKNRARFEETKTDKDKKREDKQKSQEVRAQYWANELVKEQEQIEKEKEANDEPYTLAQVQALAKEKIKKRKSTNAALHRIDEVAGGSPTGTGDSSKGQITEDGDARVNSSIGSQWKGTRINGLTKKVEDQKKELDKKFEGIIDFDKVRMNVKLK